MARDPELAAHLEWLGYIQPVGLVVSPPALLQAQASINRNVIPQHQRFLGCLSVDPDDQPIPQINDFRRFVREVLDWQDSDLVAFEGAHSTGIDVSGLEVVLPEYNETLRPTWIVPEFQSPNAAPSVAAPEQRSNAERVVMLIQEIPAGKELDEPIEEADRRWHASPHARFERLLRETQVPAGLLTNGRNLRLVYAPRGETSGYLTFNVDEMTTVAGRPIFSAFHMLLNSDRLFNLEKKQRLPSILMESRKYQNTVSTQLAQQVMAAMYELLRGFQAADDQWNGRLLKDILAREPQHVYHGLLTVLMRSVFVLYAEDRNLLSNHPVYTNYYSITGLFERLRADAGQYPDTMDQRYGAWAQLLTLFRMIYEGGSHAELQIPPRKGYLFDPTRYPFLEGIKATTSSSEETPFPTAIPRVSDGVVYRVLNNLLMLDGERLSYRSLDVEQIGSVYEAIMGFEVEVSTGRSIAIKPVKKHGAPATINLEQLLATEKGKRAAWLKDHSDQELTGKALEAFKAATTIEELLAALGNKIASDVTPNVVAAGAMIFQPSDERRRSGSHYTPRSLTEPIVRTTLEPILKQLCDPEAPLAEVYQPSKEDKRRYTQGEIDARIRLSERAIEQAMQARVIGTPHPSQILDLKICDPAMGSGAFLVEACRQLADELVKAWYAHQLVPTDIPPDEDEVLYARRQVAQRCLYGVDKNEMAVDLAKLSLWLVTLAKDHPFTFLDHSLRHGDSLVGLTRKQIIGFHWEPKKQKQFGEDLIQKRLDRATEARAKILNAREDVPYRDQEQRLALADEALNVVRMTGDACVSAFFAGKKAKEREKLCEELFLDVARHFQALKDNKFDVEARSRIAHAAGSLRTGAHPLPPFHWEIEFPEVFSRASGGFDAFVGNPPFAGKNNLLCGSRKGFVDWLKEIHEASHGNADLVAHFFRRFFSLLCPFGKLGFIATKTIGEGDTRSTGLRWICSEGKGTIYRALRRLVWPGQAAVIVSVVWISRSFVPSPFFLDRREVQKITAFLFDSGSSENPDTLSENAKLAFIGSYVLGMGFTFDDTDKSGVASPLSVMADLISSDSRNSDVIFPYIGGEEINTDPQQLHHRYIINFSDMSEEEASRWPALLKIVETKVKGTRGSHSTAPWWQFERIRGDLYRKIAPLQHVLVMSRVTQCAAVVFLPKRTVFSEQVVVFAFDSQSAFAVLQARLHEEWCRFLGSSLGATLRYTPSDAFETFPFPHAFRDDPRLDAVGCEYYEMRRTLMQASGFGLTKTYNRFHDPHEKSPEILKLRELHEAMDRAVLEAYCWHDLAQTARCEFLLDYEEDDDETSTGRPSTRKKPWRLRWPDEFRDMVLARLLELNAQRHQEELLAGKQVTKTDDEDDEHEDEPEVVKSSKGREKANPVRSTKKKGLFPPPLEREHRLLLMLLRAWDGRAVTRRALNAGMILALNDKFRTALLSNGKAPTGRRKKDVDLNRFFTELSIDGFIESAGSEHQQAWRITPNAPSTVDAPSDDVRRVNEVMEYLRSDGAADRVLITEEIVDAELYFIPH